MLDSWPTPCGSGFMSSRLFSRIRIILAVDVYAANVSWYLLSCNSNIRSVCSGYLLSCSTMSVDALQVCGCVGDGHRLPQHRHQPVPHQHRQRATQLLREHRALQGVHHGRHFNISYSFVEFINNDDVFCCVAFNKWFQQRQTYWVVQIAYHP